MARAKVGEAEVVSRIQIQLASTEYACSTLIPLSGGTANFIFRGSLTQPLDDGATVVIVKHGEGFSATAPGLRLSTQRCIFEQKCLELVRQYLPAASTQFCSVRTPKLLYFDNRHAQWSTQIQECLNNSLDLKSYILKHLSSSTPNSEKPKLVEVGRVLGAWLRNFHDWAADGSSGSLQLRELIASNREMQGIKLQYNYRLLLSRVEAYPDLLAEAKPVFEQLIALAEAELTEEHQLQVIHGDFWTGNILIPDDKIYADHQAPLFVIDWEMCQLWLAPLDLGQMIAEMYEFTLYKGIKAGLWLIEGFVAGYGSIDDAFAYRTLLHIGTHLVGFGSMVPGWGTPEQCKNVASVGKDIILQAWSKNRAWFESHDLGALFQSD